MFGAGAITNIAAVGAAAAPPWQPSDLGADLLAFWDAETVASLTLAGELVTTWADQVAGYAATQATSGFKPVYSATSFNSRPGVTFDGTDDYLRTAAMPAALPVGTDPSEIWALVSQDFAGTQTGNQVTLQYGDAGNTNYRTVRRAGFSNVSRGVAVAGVTPANDTVVDFSGIHVARGTISSTAVTIAVDGNTAASASGTFNTAASGNASLGANSASTPNRFWKGPMNAIIVTKPLSTDNAALLLAYLKARGGLP